MTPLPWSHSTLNQFATCARQYEEVKVLRNFQDEKNEASLWGDRFHKAAEKYIDAQNKGLADATLSADMTPYRAYLAQFIDRPGQTFVERQYALDRRLQPCEFLGPQVWCRGIIDVLTLNGYVANVDDHKTGKNRKKDMQQLIIFALLVFYHHPEIQVVHTAYHWLKYGGVQDKETFTRGQIPELWETLIPKLDRYRRAFDSGIFQPTPSGLCKKYCPVKTCEYYQVGPRR